MLNFIGVLCCVHFVLESNEGYISYMNGDIVFVPDDTYSWIAMIAGKYSGEKEKQPDKQTSTLFTVAKRSKIRNSPEQPRKGSG